jgi:hypothetical protein
MAIPQAKSGEVIEIRPLWPLAQAPTTTLVKTKTLETIRLVILQGKAFLSIRPAGKLRSNVWKGASPSARAERLTNLSVDNYSISRLKSRIPSTASKTHRYY